MERLSPSTRKNDAHESYRFNPKALAPSFHRQPEAAEELALGTIVRRDCGRSAFLNSRNGSRTVLCGPLRGVGPLFGAVIATPTGS